MKLEQSFDVQAPIDVVWRALNDLERVAPCLPGATITGHDDDIEVVLSRQFVACSGQAAGHCLGGFGATPGEAALQRLPTWRREEHGRCALGD